MSADSLGGKNVDIFVLLQQAVDRALVYVLLSLVFELRSLLQSKGETVLPA